MRVFGYIFLARDKDHLMTEAEQQVILQEYTRNLGQPLDAIFVEKSVPLKLPFKDRSAAGKLLGSCGPGDAILSVKTEWVFNSAGDGRHLLQLLKSTQIALHCMDLGGNISLPEKRRLMVSEGLAPVIDKLLAALTASESSSRLGQEIPVAKKHRKDLVKFLGGPVPFGWEVNGEGYLAPNEEQQLIIDSIIDMRKNRLSYREISQKLHKEYKISLSHEGVRRICRSDIGNIEPGKAQK